MINAKKKWSDFLDKEWKATLVWSDDQVIGNLATPPTGFWATNVTERSFYCVQVKTLNNVNTWTDAKV